MAPLVRGRKGEFKDLFRQVRKNGYLRVRVDGDVKPLEEVEQGLPSELEAANPLAGDEQAALRRAAEASTAAQRRFWAEYESAALASLAEAGVEFSEIADLGPFRRAVEPLYERHRQRYGDLVRRLREGAAADG